MAIIVNCFKNISSIGYHSQSVGDNTAPTVERKKTESKANRVGIIAQQTTINIYNNCFITIALNSH